MILNTWTVGYTVLDAVSLGAGLVAVATGIRLIPRWNRTSVGSEERLELERYVYLISTLMAFVLVTRLAMVPLWFWTLATLVPSMPGVMCLTGVHLVTPWSSVAASLMQFLLPGFYLAWLLAYAIDQGNGTQPHAMRRLWSLPLLGLLLAMTAMCEMGTLLVVEPRPMGCCSSLFGGAHVVPPVLGSARAAFLGVTSVTFLPVIAVLLVRRLRPGRARWSLSFLVLVNLAVVLLGIQFVISPVVLGRPGHFCVFCMWKESVSSVRTTSSRQPRKVKR